ncbi:hypothetical protein Fmac_005958 [Flemingia macrophylla]|uniref:Uncharacterized protein n=1 Tax=Flemingia macrophylla TaxID=520843 RepID=A0ABD1NAP1_9FABA
MWKPRDTCHFLRLTCYLPNPLYVPRSVPHSFLNSTFLRNTPNKVTLSGFTPSTTILEKYSNTIAPPHEWKIQQAWPQRQRVALSHCQISDSMTKLSRALNELLHLRAGTFEWQMSNTQTWTSAALKLEVKRKVIDLGMLTSNALYMINRLGDTGRN